MSSSIALALTTYWVWTFTGPYAWLVRAQMRTLHMYLIGVTAIVTFMVVAIPITTAARSIAAAAGLRADRVPFYVNLAYHRPEDERRNGRLYVIVGTAVGLTLIAGATGAGWIAGRRRRM